MLRGSWHTVHAVWAGQPPFCLGTNMSLVMHVQGEKVLTVWLVFESNLFTDVNKPALVSDRDRCSAWGRVWTRYKGRPHDFDIGVCMQDLFFLGEIEGMRCRNVRRTRRQGGRRPTNTQGPHYDVYCLCARGKVSFFVTQQPSSVSRTPHRTPQPPRNGRPQHPATCFTRYTGHFIRCAGVSSAPPSWSQARRRESFAFACATLATMPYCSRTGQ